MCLISLVFEGGSKHAKNVLALGVKIGSDATKSGKNTNLSVIMCVRLLNTIGLHNLTNWNQFTKVNIKK